ncbi:voltage-gated chloride channel protein [Vagococcus coleopterorum]|uniref:Voltage-gated chloride channel protein n=1 Tax=Vagococcus coleopterorum TaxID=2714946 RepID=A0A6G8ANF4_9ENTE|nr:chloride channel protein [Vagococcus coleopterorum]QIL46499.1 voltage-gated chloride channel protein [Vagococcus coleopterorum]
MDSIKKIGITMIKWLSVCLVIGVATGLLSSFFLTSLSWATTTREANQWLIFGMPLIVMVFTWLYQKYGGLSHQGNNLVIRRANGSDNLIPLVLIPLTLFGTITSHLFGASVGREGTAVQMGGSWSEQVAKWFNLSDSERQTAIICGISGGFASVFGTPFAGAIFAVEVIMIGRFKIRGLLPSLLTALIANQVTVLVGIQHSHYAAGIIPDFSISLLLKVLLASIAFGCVATLFSWSIRQIKTIYSHLIVNPVLRAGFGGLVVLGLVGLFGTTRYLGLSLPLLSDAFAGTHQLFDFINKLLFTVFSLGAGFQGGEVTPLFEIGATLGASLATMLQVTVPFLASLGFIGVFAGATNAPLACAVMGVELFGLELAPWLLLASYVSCFFASSKGIYIAQGNQLNKVNFCKLISQKKDL